MKTVLKQEKTYCDGCPLNRSKGKQCHYVPTEVYYDRVGPDGKPEVDILVVGDAVGKAEDDNSMPFVSPNGEELRAALKKIGIVSSYAVAHSVRCRPTDEAGNNRVPSLEEMVSCSNYIKQDLIQLKPKVVVLMGNTAKDALAPTQEWKTRSIGKLKGEIFVQNGITYTATVNPSMFLRSNNYNERERFHRHIGNIGRILTGEQGAYSRKGVSTLLRTEKEADDFLDLLENFETEWACVDTEGDSLHRVAKFELSTIQFALDNDIGFVLPLEHWQSPWSPEFLEHLRQRLGRIFTNPNLKIGAWVAHNAKFDYWQIIRWCGIESIARPFMDTIFLEYLRDENTRRGMDDDDGGAAGGGGNAFDLKSMAKDKLGFYHYNSKILESRKGGTLVQEPLWNPDGSVSEFTVYAGMDVYVGRRLACYITNELGFTSHKDKSLQFAEKWGSRITHLLGKVEANGGFADKDQLAYLQSDNSPILTRMAEIPHEVMDSPEGKKANSLILSKDPRTKGMKPLFGKAPTVFDIDKKDHRIALLVDTCGLEPLAYGTKKGDKKSKYAKKGKNGEIDKGNGVPSINKAFFNEYKDHQFAALVQEYEGLKKLKSSYLNSVMSFLTDEVIYTKRGPKSNADNLFDGRIHATFWDSRTVTGRFASSDPNLQQLPRNDNFAKGMIKSMYGAAPGHVMLEADFGQAEIRWWGQIAKDQEFANLFNGMVGILEEFERNPTPELAKRVENECDIHKQVSSAMNRIPIEQVTKDMRQAAKGLSFGSLYGMSPKSLAILVKCSEDEAKQLIKTFTMKFERAGGWLEYIENFALDNGYVISPYGRARHLGPLIELNEGAARRVARNSPIQGAASDTTALAAWLIQNWIEQNRRPYKIWNVVHDAISVEVPLNKESILEIMQVMKDCMTRRINSFLKEEFGINMIVPLVIDFKVGLRWGHCETVDPMTNIDEFVAMLQEQDRRLHNGDKWWQIATELEIKKIQKKMSKAEKEKKDGWEKDMAKLTKIANEHKNSLAKAG